MRILLGISGGIAAYKTPELVRELQKAGHEVRCILTAGASEFVSPLVLQTLTHAEVPSSLFGPSVKGTDHIDYARWPDVILVAPATAQTLARITHGLADDLLSTVVLASRSPVFVAPAMNTAMWENAATQANLATLKARGITVIEPDSGVLACGEEGAGKLPELARIVNACVSAGPTPVRTQDLAGTRWLITAGPTRTHIDPVRYITNPSTGTMGKAMAEEALSRGATVDYVLGMDKGVVMPEASGEQASRLHLTQVLTAQEMLDASLRVLDQVDGVIATAAVMDYEVRTPSHRKLKRSTSDCSLELTPAVDVLGTLRARCSRPSTLFVGFAAETDSVLENGLKKLHAKKLDYLFANPIAGLGELAQTGFGTPTNSGFWISKQNPSADHWPVDSKREIARRIWDQVSAALNG